MQGLFLHWDLMENVIKSSLYPLTWCVDRSIFPLALSEPIIHEGKNFRYLYIRNNEVESDDSHRWQHKLIKQNSTDEVCFVPNGGFGDGSIMQIMQINPTRVRKSAFEENSIHDSTQQQNQLWMVLADLQTLKPSFNYYILLFCSLPSFYSALSSFPIQLFFTFFIPAIY